MPILQSNLCYWICFIRERLPNKGRYPVLDEGWRHVFPGIGDLGLIQHMRGSNMRGSIVSPAPLFVCHVDALSSLSHHTLHYATFSVPQYPVVQYSHAVSHPAALPLPSRTYIITSAWFSELPVGSSCPPARLHMSI